MYICGFIFSFMLILPSCKEKDIHEKSMKRFGGGGVVVDL
jgi:hypothetical protein